MILRRLLLACVCAAALAAPALAQIQGSGVGQSGSVTANNATCWASNGVVKDCGSAPGTGNVTGPGSAVSGDIATFNGVTGKIIQDSGIVAANVLLTTTAHAGLINEQVFSATGTYTPTAGTNAIEVEVLAQGGGGGGCGASSATQNCIAGSAAAGSYAKVYYATTPGTQTVTIGTTGAGGATGNNPGTVGATASFGALISCPGGTAGAGGAPFTATTASIVLGAVSPAACTIAGGTPTTLVSTPGAPAAPSLSLGLLADNVSGIGGGTLYGAGGAAGLTTAAGANATGSGAGGGSGVTANAASSAGGNPSGGLIVVREFR